MRCLMFIAALICCSTLIAQEPSSTDLQTKYEQRQWFELRDRSSHQKISEFHQGALAVAFNHTEEAEKKLHRVIQHNSNKNEVEDARSWLVYMYFRAGEYRRALVETNAALKANPGDQSMASFREMMTVLAESPDLFVAKRNSQTVKSKLVGGNIFVPVVVNGKTGQYIVDSGANISLISESEAKRLGLQLVAADKGPTMAGSTGGGTDYKLAIAPTLVLGGVEIHNVAFLVLRDEQQPFVELPPAERGVLGIPVLLALQSFRWSSNGDFTVGITLTKSAAQNLCFDGADPIVQGEVEGSRLPFLFDTGSEHMDFYPPFAQRFATLVATGKKEGKTVRGVEGSRIVENVTLPEVSMQVGGFRGVVRPAHVLLEETGGTSKRYFGRMGMQFLGQAHAMTVDFENMSVKME